MVSLLAGKKLMNYPAASGGVSEKHSLLDPGFRQDNMTP